MPPLSPLARAIVICATWIGLWSIGVGLLLAAGAYVAMAIPVLEQRITDSAVMTGAVIMYGHEVAR